MLPSSARTPQPTQSGCFPRPIHCPCVRQSVCGSPHHRPPPVLWLAAAGCRTKIRWVDCAHKHPSSGGSLSDQQRAGTGLHKRRTANAPFGSQRATGLPQSQPQRAVSPGDRQSDGRAYNNQPRPPLPRQRPGPQRPLDYRQQRGEVQPQEPASISNRPSHVPSQGSEPAGRPLLGLQAQQQQQEEPRLQPQRPSYSRGATVHFSLQYHTNYGERIRLVGSHERLGAWQLRNGLDLDWTEGNNWVADVELPAGAVYEYKYVLLDAHSGHALSWQRGNNSVLALRAGEDRVEVFDNWEGQPGAAVVTAGGSATRERRLLDWANEMEALVSTQRNDLRRARMELVAATEDAAATRAELRSTRAELARSRAAQATERRKAAELAAQNQALSQHLVETTASFREALQLVETLLGDDAPKDNDSDSGDGAAVSAPSQPTSPTTTTSSDSTNTSRSINTTGSGGPLRQPETGMAFNGSGAAEPGAPGSRSSAAGVPAAVP